MRVDTTTADVLSALDTICNFEPSAVSARVRRDHTEIQLAAHLVRLQVCTEACIPVLRPGVHLRAVVREHLTVDHERWRADLI